MVIYNPAGVSYSSHVAVYPSGSLNLTRVIVAPSHNEGKVSLHNTRSNW